MVENVIVGGHRIHGEWKPIQARTDGKAAVRNPQTGKAYWAGAAAGAPDDGASAAGGSLFPHSRAAPLVDTAKTALAQAEKQCAEASNETDKSRFSAIVGALTANAYAEGNLEPVTPAQGGPTDGDRQPTPCERARQSR